MPPPDPTPESAHAKFDAYAETYEALHANSIGASGEQPAYFADYKVACLGDLLGRDFPLPVLDYGCGIGELTERLARVYSHVSGYDPSPKSLERARAQAPTAKFYDDPSSIPESTFGAVVLANVLHHVAPPDRPHLMATLSRLLLPGRGLLVVFEHNPYNPLTQWAVSRCPFDDDAVLLPRREIRQLFHDAGLARQKERFIVFFPRQLAWFRAWERRMGWLPIGAQLMAVARAADGSEPD